VRDPSGQAAPDPSSPPGHPASLGGGAGGVGVAIPRPSTGTRRSQEPAVQPRGRHGTARRGATAAHERTVRRAPGRLPLRPSRLVRTTRTDAEPVDPPRLPERVCQWRNRIPPYRDTPPARQSEPRASLSLREGQRGLYCSHYHGDPRRQQLHTGPALRSKGIECVATYELVQGLVPAGDARVAIP